MDPTWYCQCSIHVSRIVGFWSWRSLSSWTRQWWFIMCQLINYCEWYINKCCNSAPFSRFASSTPPSIVIGTRKLAIMTRTRKISTTSACSILLLLMEQYKVIILLVQMILDNIFCETEQGCDILWRWIQLFKVDESLVPCAIMQRWALERHVLISTSYIPRFADI